MSNILFPNLISSLSTPTKTVTNTSAQTGADSTSQSVFRDLLTAMILSSFLSQGSSSSDLGGMGMQQLMTPLMINLLEKLFAGQLQTDQTATVQDNIVKEAPSTPVDTPKGRPVKGVLTQESHPGHIALDFGVPVGTPVKATMDGKVVYSSWNNEGYGNLLIVENGPYRTYFAHLSEFNVKAGDQIHAGQIVAHTGNTGNSTGPHLHYEIRKNGTQINPANFTT